MRYSTGARLICRYGVQVAGHSRKVGQHYEPYHSVSTSSLFILAVRTWHHVMVLWIRFRIVDDCIHIRSDKFNQKILDGWNLMHDL